MRIAMFTDSYLPTHDGVVSSILNYQAGLKRKGHRMLVFAPHQPHAKPDRDVFRYPAVAFPPYPEYKAAIMPVMHPAAVKKSSAQLVHSKAMVNMGLAAISYSKMKKIPAMASLETMIPDGVHYVLPVKELHGFGKALGWAYLRWFYSNFSCVTAPSFHAKGLMEENRITAEVLASPIDTEKFRPNRRGEMLKRRIGLPGKKIILSVGRVVKEKNYSFLIRAAKKMRDKDVVFLVAGKGPYLDALMREVLFAGVSHSFYFAGFVPDDALVDYYNAADCFAFPSQFETQGLTHLEAMACGKPACVLDNTPMSEIIEEGKNGYVFSDDEDEAAEKLEDCIGNSKSMAGAARRTAERYSIPVCTDALLKCYRRLLE